MQLVDIFGRNSTALRGNVHYDQAGRVVYSSGHALVVFDKVKKSKDLVYLPEDHLFQNIGAICMSKDKSKVYCCHNGTRAGLVVWKIGAKIPIKEMIIDCMSTVLYISVNDNDSRIVVYGINSHCEAYIGLIDVKE